LAPTNILLGAIAGVTIFLGLPVARWRGASERLRGLLTLASAGVLLFLIIEVGYHAMESVEATAKGASVSAALMQGLIFAVGVLAGLVGLAWLESRRARQLKAGAEALEIATMIAIGIGLHNFAEGLAIGQLFAGGAVSLGTVLVIGFALHNATEGFGIAGPLAGREVSWGRLLWLGLIGGGPTAIGAFVGGIWVNPSVELLFLALATGSLIYVTRELLRIRFQTLGAVGAMMALSVGLFIGFGTELVAEVAQSRAVARVTSATGNMTVRFANKEVDPASLTLARGSSLTIENGGNVPLVFEGNGMFVGEVVVSAGGKVSVPVTGSDGEYRLVDERGQSASAKVTVRSGGVLEPLTDEVNAVGALTVLEGHVRASKELHDRGVSGQGPDPALDLKRAGKHAGHPQHELLEGNEPDAVALQRLLRARGAFDQLNDALSAYVKLSGDKSASKPEVDQKYEAARAAAEQARRAIAGNAYDAPTFRARAARFVMDTAASEYATASEGGRIAVEVPGVPGKDNFIEYQDARDFLRAARELLLRGRSDDGLTADSRIAFDKLLSEVFTTLDPPDPNRPLPAAEVKALIERAERGLVR
jgi:zinc transporter, ZIP family